MLSNIYVTYVPSVIPEQWYHYPTTYRYSERKPFLKGHIYNGSVPKSSVTYGKKSIFHIFYVFADLEHCKKVPDLIGSGFTKQQ